MAKYGSHSLHGNMSLLGLGEFGEGWNELWGTAIGGGISALTSISVAHMGDGKMAADRHFYGLSAGLLASGLMYAKKSTRHLAVPSALGAALVSFLPWLEQKVFGTVQAPVKAVQAPAADQPTTAPAGVGRLGLTRAHRLGPAGMNGLGYTNMQRLNGLGITTLAPSPEVYGGAVGVANPAPSVGMAGPTFAGTQVGRVGKMTPPVSLLGPATSQSKQVQLLGGPTIHGLSTQYGATLLGGGR